MSLWFRLCSTEEKQLYGSLVRSTLNKQAGEDTDIYDLSTDSEREK